MLPHSEHASGIRGARLTVVVKRSWANAHRAFARRDLMTGSWIHYQWELTMAEKLSRSNIY